MRRLSILFFPFVAILGPLALSPNLHAMTCGALAQLRLPHGVITSSTLEHDTIPTPSGSTPIRGLPSFCRVLITLTPSSDSNIHVDLWLPTENWNGKFQGTGNGGFAGAINVWILADALRRGYAAANTDMGTSPAATEGGDVLINHPEKWQDWGSRATHEMTVASKAMLEAFYGRSPKYAYFNGCSTGGEQGLMEAQRYPDDYDGIISGAPAQNRTHLHMEIFWNFAVSLSKPEDRIPDDKLPIITSAVLKSCSAQKAHSTDAFLSLDPADCHWSPEALLCKAGDRPDCLTSEQVAAAKKIYEGPSNPVSHTSIYPGVEPGSEFGWNQFIPKDGKPPFGSIFRWVFGPEWNWRSFDFNNDVATMDTRLAPIVNATNPDLHAFRDAGHKLILYHGWADWLVPPRETVTYYDAVVQANSPTAPASNSATDVTALDATRRFARLYMVPGMGHCSSGPGLNSLDPLTPLEYWVEKGTAPESLPAWRDERGTKTLARPVCAYPQVAQYNGKGDPADAGNFACSADHGSASENAAGRYSKRK